jgi:hypothetical protein
MSSRQIAEIVGCTKAAVTYNLRRLGIPLRTLADAKRMSDSHKPRTSVTKVEMVEAYGGKCACCGETEMVFLSLDHVDGGGSAHRKSLGGNGGRKILQEAKAAGWPGAYRVLCMNCQFGTRYGRACPHQSGFGQVGAIHEEGQSD